MASPEKTAPKVQADDAPVAKSDKIENLNAEGETIESGIETLPDIDDLNEEISLAEPEPEKTELEQDRVSEAVTEKVVEEPPEGATTGETEELKPPEIPEEPVAVAPELPEVDADSEESQLKAAKKITKHRKEIERKKRKREECRKKKLDVTYQVEVEQKQPEEEQPVLAVETVLSLSSSLSSSSDSSGVDAAVVIHHETREEDIMAKESVLGALGLQSTRMAQQERPKVPKLKLVVRPTPAKKKGHKNENGNEKTYAICHEVIILFFTKGSPVTN